MCLLEWLAGPKGSKGVKAAAAAAGLHCLRGMPGLVSGQVQHLQEATKAVLSRGRHLAKILNCIKVY